MSHLKIVFMLVLGSFCLAATGQPRESVEGRHYHPLPVPVATDTEDDVIEVRELFWYGCPECATLAPLMTVWRDGVTGDLEYSRMPAVWNEVMSLHAQLYYAARSLNVEDSLHAAAFHAIHEDGNPLRSVPQIRDFFISNGISAEDFDTTWQSAEVMENTEQARVLTQDYAADKLPAIIVNGRYSVTHNQFVTDHTELNIATNLVIRKLRNERRDDF